MPKIILLPIEPIPDRYSVDWLRWFNGYLLPQDIVIDPAPLTKGIENGSFLDVCGTNYYKAVQIAIASVMIHEGVIKDGDSILALDAWFPGIESIAYMRDALGMNIKIYGCLHAGTYDHHDFLSKKGMGKWGKHLENSWFSIYDKVFVATKFHRDLVCAQRHLGYDKVVITGFPIYQPYSYIARNKENIVVFPHRLDEEKRPKDFDYLKSALQVKHPSWSFVKSKDVCSNKEEYYKLLCKSKISVSCALQETWGIAMQESVLCGCLPVVPNRLSYKEMYPSYFRYSDVSEMVRLVDDCITMYTELYSGIKGMQGLIEYNGKLAIPNMLKEIGHERTI